MGQAYIKFIAEGPTPFKALNNLERSVQAHYPGYKLKICTGLPVCFVSETNDREFVVNRDESVVPKDYYRYFVHLLKG